MNNNIPASYKIFFELKLPRNSHSKGTITSEAQRVKFTGVWVTQLKVGMLLVVDSLHLRKEICPESEL